MFKAGDLVKPKDPTHHLYSTYPTVTYYKVLSDQCGQLLEIENPSVVGPPSHYCVTVDFELFTQTHSTPSGTFFKKSDIVRLKKDISPHPLYSFHVLGRTYEVKNAQIGTTVEILIPIFGPYYVSADDFELVPPSLNAPLSTSIPNRRLFMAGDMVRALKDLPCYIIGPKGGLSAILKGTICTVRFNEHRGMFDLITSDGHIVTLDSCNFELYLATDQPESIQSVTEKHKCQCVFRDLLMNGCQCGGI